MSAIHVLTDWLRAAEADLAAATTDEQRTTAQAAINRNRWRIAVACDAYSHMLTPHHVCNGTTALRQVTAAEFWIAIAERRAVDFRRCAG